MNYVIVSGRVVRDPICRTTKYGRWWAIFTVAVNRAPYIDREGNKVEKTDFFTVKVFNNENLAQAVGNYLHKGSVVSVSGTMENSPQKQEDGNWKDNWAINPAIIYPCMKYKAPEASAEDTAAMFGADPEPEAQTTAAGASSGKDRGNFSQFGKTVPQQTTLGEFQNEEPPDVMGGSNDEDIPF